MLACMQAGKRIPFDDPTTLMGIRGVYILSNLIIFGMYAYIYSRINAKKGNYLHFYHRLPPLRIQMN